LTVVPEFSRPVRVDRIGADGLTQRIEATEAECAALAVRLDVPAVRRLAATFTLRRGESGRIAAEGRLAARLVRVCVVSLDEFETDMDETFSVLFVPEGALGEALDLEGDDEIPYAGGAIDLGDAAAEQVALTLDPYPRRPGAELPAEAGEAAESPFAVLRQVKGND